MTILFSCKALLRDYSMRIEFFTVDGFVAAGRRSACARLFRDVAEGSTGFNYNDNVDLCESKQSIWLSLAEEMERFRKSLPDLLTRKRRSPFCRPAQPTFLRAN